MRLISRLEQQSRLDRPVSAGQRAARLIRPGRLRDTLHGVWLGHPLHPVLVQAPAGAWLSAAILDLTRHNEKASRHLAAAGLIAAAPAALAGCGRLVRAARSADARRHRPRRRQCRRTGPVLTVDQALIRGHRQPGPVGDGLRRLDRPPQRAGDHQGRAPRAQRHPEPPGLLTPGLIQRRVGQAAQDAGLVQRRLPVPGQVDDSTVRSI